MKKCTKCNKEFSSKNISRHRKTCKGVIINGKRPCKICGKFFRTDNLKKHLNICKGQMDEVAVLKQTFIDVMKENKKLLEEKEKLLEEKEKDKQKIHEYELKVM